MTTQLPDRDAPLAARRRKRKGPSEEASAHIGQVLVQTLKALWASTRRSSANIFGRRVTRDRFQLAPGTKVAKVAGAEGRPLGPPATTEIRILAPIPGKQAVGVEVPNPSPTLSRSATSTTTCPRPEPLGVWLGKDISGNAVWTDLARMPHLLIAGTTGSGKSGCINTILTRSCCARRRTRCG